MNTILSFCKLDFFRLMQNNRWNIGVALLSMVAVFLAPDHQQLIYFFYLYLVMCCLVSLISMDEQEHGSYLGCMLPVSRHYIVAGRFTLYFILLTAIGTIYMILGYLSPVGRPDNFVLQINLCYCMSLIFTGITQALVYRFNYSSVRVFTIIIFAFMYSFIALLISLLQKLSTWPQPVLALMVTLSGLLCFIVCLLTAQMLYRRKDIKD